MYLYTYIQHTCFHSVLLLQRGCENLENTFKGHVGISTEEKEKQAAPGLGGLETKSSSQTATRSLGVYSVGSRSDLEPCCFLCEGCLVSLAKGLLN